LTGFITLTGVMTALRRNFSSVALTSVGFLIRIHQESMQFSETSNWGFSHEMMFTHVFFWTLTEMGD